MLGWINDCIEKLVLDKFDVDTWHAIKERAGLEDVKDGGFLKLEHYSDKSTTDLVEAAAELSGLSVPQVYEVRPNDKLKALERTNDCLCV
jgi:hypothetical protein